LFDIVFTCHQSSLTIFAFHFGGTKMELEPWLSVEGIARHLGISKETIYRWLEREIVPAHRMGKLWRFKPSEVDQWIMSGGASEGLERNSDHGTSK
jgi:excisionase family DNA binding protein